MSLVAFTSNFNGLFGRKILFTGCGLLCGFAGWLAANNPVVKDEGIDAASFEYDQAIVEQYTEPVSLPTKTNSWFSNLYFDFPSQPIFALPGAYKFTEKEIELSFPTVVGKPDTVFGSFIRDCGLSLGGPLDKPEVVRYGDWNTVVSVSRERGEQVFLAQGYPGLYVNVEGKKLTLSCNQPTVTLRDSSLLVKTIENKYFLVRSSGLEFAQNGDTVEITSDGQLFAVNILPDAREETISLFESEGINPILDTKVEFEVNGKVKTKYVFESLQKTNVLTTLWPHQKSYLSSDTELLESSYKTNLGEMSLIQVSEFSTEISESRLPTSFTKVRNTQHAREIVSAIEDDIKSLGEEIVPYGVYFKGTWLGAASSLIQLADAYGVEASVITQRMESVLLSSLDEFEYDSNLQTIVAKNPEFGNEFGNDHHFHYGYYVRAAAVLANKKPELVEQLSPTIDKLVADIASVEGKEYSKLRNFSVYEGHSLADGRAGFGDGNNQESTSEALNAWYAVSLWGELKEDEDLETVGQWLFAQELAGTKAYWFGEENPFPAGYEHEMASLVWHGKRDFTTWFSPQAMHIYGIQWLPVTPASNYLSEIVGAEEMIDEIDSLEADPAGHEWGDLYVAFMSYHNPDKALGLVSKVNSTGGMKVKSLLLQTVFSNLER